MLDPHHDAGLQDHRRHRLRTAVAILLLTPLLGVLGAELGTLAAVNGAETDAIHYRQVHDWPAAVAVYRSLAGRTGPLSLLARSKVDAAPAAAEGVFLDWASDLVAAGHVDEALAACERVSMPGLFESAQRRRAEIALGAARAAAGAGHFDVALHRLDQLTVPVDPLARVLPPADLTAQAASLRPQYAVEGGRALLAAGRAREAVAAFDEVIGQAASSPQAATARTLLPGALLAAGRASLAAPDDAAALAQLQRLVDTFPASSEARKARALLEAPQPVSGTLVHRDGTPVAGSALRLGSNYRQQAGGYLTSAPYFQAVTNARGDFSITDVPIGGPYVLEVASSDGWSTIITKDPATKQDEPAYQVTITPLAPVNLAYVVLPA